MLRWLSSGTALALLTGIAIPLFAGSAQAQDAKLGVVDRGRAISTCQAGKNAQKDLQALQETKQKQLAPMEEQLKSLTQDFESQKFVLSQDALEERRIEIARKKSALERAVEEAREELAIAERNALQPIIQKVDGILSEIGKERGLMMIMERSSPGVLYFSDALDITDVLIDRLNKS